MGAKVVSYTLESTLDSVNMAEQTADQIATRAGFPEDERHQIMMAVREAAVNAVLHGNAYDPAKKMTVTYEAEPGQLTIRIADQGRGLDPEEIPDPLAPENLLKQSGRGVFLIRSFMDEVSFKNLHPGTEITLVKRVSTPAADAKEESK